MTSMNDLLSGVVAFIPPIEDLKIPPFYSWLVLLELSPGFTFTLVEVQPCFEDVDPEIQPNPPICQYRIPRLASKETGEELNQTQIGELMEKYANIALDNALNGKETASLKYQDIYELVQR